MTAGTEENKLIVTSVRHLSAAVWKRPPEGTALIEQPRRLRSSSLARMPDAEERKYIGRS
jgi:hypothetical protein